MGTPPVGTQADGSPPSVRVPPTAEGCATAVTHLSAALATTGPERSHPDCRGHPPLVEVRVGEPQVPDVVAEATPDTGIELRLPESLTHAVVGAPLAYYLGASVSVGASEPALVAPDAGVHEPLGTLPEFQGRVVDLLRRVFALDCLVRSRPGEPVLAGRDRFDALNPATARAADPDERLALYLSVPAASIPGGLPDWHLATYTEPDGDTVRCLPYLCDDLSLLYTAEASEIDPQGLLTMALDDFFRAADPYRRDDSVPSVDLLDPDLGAGELHAWLAEGVPLEAYSTSLAAFRNRVPPDPDGLSVAVVLNDERMADERETVVDSYRKADRGVELTVEESLPAAELARLFEEQRDLVHYIGHCDDAGLRCTDGHLAVDDVRVSNAETFLLNACGSYYEGVDLVRKGSVAGAVTFNKVLDRHAARVGTTFVRLLVNGFSIERALGLARRRIIMGKDYAVVGDGTHTIADGDASAPADATLERGPDGGFELSYRAHDARRFGDTYRPPVPGVDDTHLYGSERTVSLDASELREFLRTADIPVVYDGDIHWADDLATMLE